VYCRVRGQTCSTDDDCCFSDAITCLGQVSTIDPSTDDESSNPI
jgi:hypothetical protein